MVMMGVEVATIVASMGEVCDISTLVEYDSEEGCEKQVFQVFMRDVFLAGKDRCDPEYYCRTQHPESC